MAEALNQFKPPGGARICTLKYRAPDTALDSAAGEVIFLAVKNPDSLKLYCRQNFKQLIAARDRKFIEELLDDMIQRAQDSPDELFEQLSELSVGPIVADSMQSFNPPHNDQSPLFADFIPATAGKSNPTPGEQIRARDRQK